MMVAEVVTNYSEANIPVETVWSDIDYSKIRPALKTPQKLPFPFSLFPFPFFVFFFSTDQNSESASHVDPRPRKVPSAQGP